MNAPVLFDERSAANGVRYGIATLNSPQTLNSLSLEMCHLLDAQLIQWERDPEIALVILQGQGEKAFCAGGDLQSLYRSMKEAPRGKPWENAYAREFFEVEYRLDYRIHHYSKPLLCWGNGFVIGGGVGLLMGASHRVLSETSRISMPEISIGLFPDVGATWMLNRMAGSSGLFLALTGAQLEASDAIACGLADFCINNADWPKLLEAIDAQPWAGVAHGGADASANERLAPRAINDGILRQAILSLDNQAAATPGPLKKNLFQINNLCNSSDLEEIVADLIGLSDSVDPWLAKAAKTLARGAPGSARLAFALQREARMMSLADVFRLEYIVALNCVAQGDLVEGIRALLIDKDKSPRWDPATLTGASASWVKPLLEARWLEGRAHPLADLGAIASTT